MMTWPSVQKSEQDLQEMAVGHGTRPDLPKVTAPGMSPSPVRSPI